MAILKADKQSMETLDSFRLERKSKVFIKPNPETDTFFVDAEGKGHSVAHTVRMNGIHFNIYSGEEQWVPHSVLALVEQCLVENVEHCPAPKTGQLINRF